MRIRFTDPPLRLAVRALAATWRIEPVGDQHLTGLREARVPTVCALWHGTLLSLLWRHRHQNTTILVGRHRDAERLAGTARRWGYRVVRGSSTRGAIAGLAGIMRVLRDGGEIALAPDGPRGPAGVAKPGAIAAAQRTGAAIVAIGVAASPCWTLASWDRFVIPAPFARVRIAYDAPFHVAPGPDGLADGVERLTRRLTAVTALARCA